MKTLFCILFITVFQRSIAQNYIEIGSYGCGVMAVTGKFILLENGKYYSCRYDLRGSQSVKDSCSTGFILEQLQKDTPKKITKIIKIATAVAAAAASSRWWCTTTHSTFLPLSLYPEKKLNHQHSRMVFSLP